MVGRPLGASATAKVSGHGYMGSPEGDISVCHVLRNEKFDIVDPSEMDSDG